MVTSGFKGYSIVVDQNEDTIPDGTVTTTSTEYTFDKLFDTDFYVHVAAVDNAGNMSEVSTFKYAYPTMKLTTNTSEVVKDTVTITAEAACEGNSIVKIITPDGKEVEGDTAEYTVDVNGTYTFIAVDNKDKEFTLLDLSIIAKHYGDNPDLLLLEGIDADLNLDGKIDKEDYKKCYELMLKNPNRKF